MTFREVVEKLRAMQIPHAIVQYEHKFHDGGIESDRLGLYTAKYGGIWVWAATWEDTFIEFQSKIRECEAKTNPPPPFAGAPEESDMIPPLALAPAHVRSTTDDDEIPS